MGVSRYIAIFNDSPESLYQTAHLLAPRVEICPPDGVLLEVPARYEQDTLNRLSQVVGFDCRVGGGSTRTVAILAARSQPGTIVAHGRERSFLAPLEISRLALASPVEEDTLQTFKRWGIYRLGQLARLPSEQLVARLGHQALRLQKIARGEEVGFFGRYQPDRLFEATLELEWPLESLDPLSFVLSGLLDNICNQLNERGLAAEALVLKLHFDGRQHSLRRLQLAVPMLDSRVMLSLLRLDLQESPPAASIGAVTLRAEPAPRRVAQYSLLEPASLSPEKLSQTVARLRRLVGTDNVGYPCPTDNHRPDSFRLRAPDGERHKPRSTPENRQTGSTLQLTLRRLRPPTSTRIDSSEILYCAGPWRSSGQWWRQHDKDGAWHRDEWDIELTDGGIYRVFWDFDDQKWFLEGIYD